VLTGAQDNEEIIQRVAALDIGKAGLGVLRAGARRGPAGQAAAGGGELFHDDPAAAGYG
jgi:hypothetical protein